VAAAVSQASAYVPPPTHVSHTVTATTSIIATSTDIAIVVDLAPTVLAHQVPTSDCQQNAAPSNAPPLDWGEVHPFAVVVYLNMEAPALPFCFGSKDEICSDDDSVFFHLSMD
jgi:hypothetical protein